MCTPEINPRSPRWPRIARPASADGGRLLERVGTGIRRVGAGLVADHVDPVAGRASPSDRARVPVELGPGEGPGPVTVGVEPEFDADLEAQMHDPQDRRRLGARATGCG